ncbi:MAG: HD domain-containing protein [Bacteroidales bacterium]|nr:HD domain-containing protein [Bacteroidales bacterium]
MSKVNVNPALVEYIEREILPRYDHFDQAHQRDHVTMVIQQSLDIASRLDVNTDMVYAIAAYHDTGLCEGREHHHEVSAQIIKADQNLRQWFTEEQILVMADAAEDHRASAKQAPRTIYGRIVAEADRFIDPDTIVRRTIQYGMDHYPELSHEEQYQRMLTHLKEKYGRNGYLKLWFPDSPNAARLERLHDMIDDEQAVRQLFEQYTPDKTN